MNIPTLFCIIPFASFASLASFQASSSEVHRCDDGSGQVTYSDVHCGPDSEIVEVNLRSPANLGVDNRLTKTERAFLRQRAQEKKSRLEKAKKKRQRYRRKSAAKKQACQKARDNYDRFRNINISYKRRWALRMAIHDKC